MNHAVIANQKSPDDVSLHDPATLATHPRFANALRMIGTELTALFDAAPGVVRYAACLQKWLLSQSVFMLDLERDPADPLSGITATRVLEIALRYGAASRNTATAHLAELLAHKLVRDIPNSPSRRVRPLELTENARAAMLAWFHGHLHCLDTLDGGNRLQRALADPGIFVRAQPRAAKRLIGDPRWYAPPPAVAAFTWTESGSNILHDLFARMPDPPMATKGRIAIGALSIADLSRRYRISRTHVRRIFVRGEELGALGWDGPPRRRTLWLSDGFVAEHAAWQAVKFAAIAEAFDWAEHASGK